MYLGEIIPSELLLNFLRYLINGPDSRRGNTLTKQRRIQSIAQDVLFAVTVGNGNPENI